MSNYLVVHVDGSVELRTAESPSDVLDCVGWGTLETVCTNLTPSGMAVTDCAVGTFDPPAGENHVATEVLRNANSDALEALTWLSATPMLRGPVAFYATIYPNTATPRSISLPHPEVAKLIGMNLTEPDVMRNMLDRTVAGLIDGILENPKAPPKFGYLQL